MQSLSVIFNFVNNQTTLAPFFTLDDFMCKSKRTVRVRIAYAPHMVTVTSAMDLSGEDIAVIKKSKFQQFYECSVRSAPKIFI